MNFDVEEHLGAVERCVSLMERDGSPASAVTLARSYPAEEEDVWDAVTNPRRVPRWFLPLSGDLSLGGRYRLEGNASGVIEACEPLSHLSLTWEFAGVSWVDVRLSDDGAGRTRLALTHTAHLSEYWDEYGPGAAGVGWEMVLAGLALHLARPEAAKPDDAAFAASADGRAFIAGSSERWGRAAVASGTDPEDAAAAARRTTAFYTGEEAG